MRWWLTEYGFDVDPIEKKKKNTNIVIAMKKKKRKWTDRENFQTVAVRAKDICSGHRKAQTLMDLGPTPFIVGR